MNIETKYLIMKLDSKGMLEHPMSCGSNIFDKYGYDSKEECYKAIIDKDNTYKDFIILEQVFISEY